LFSFKRVFNFAPMSDEKSVEYSDKQRQILEVAEKLFATKGFDGTSVRDIAQEAGVNIAMISYYFGSKEKLLQAVFELRSSHIKTQLTLMLEDQNMAPLEKVYRLIEAFVEKIMGQQQFHKIMVREQINGKETMIYSLIQESKKKNHELVKKIVQEGQKKGVFKKNIDIPLMMVTMVGTANQLITTQHFYKEIVGLESMPEAEFQKHVKKKLTIHLKTLFKAILTNDQ
jgi:DNA-binding transcriptional regulator YbjK